MKLDFFKIFIAAIILFAIPLHSQDSVAVTFRYKPLSAVSVVYLPGSFNNWGNNVNGVISDSRFTMNYSLNDQTWYRTEKLLPGTYNYKFNENGNRWITDPDNPLVNSSDNNNSIIIVKDPMFFYLTYETPSDQTSPFIIKSNLFSSDNNPINPDSSFIYVNNILKSSISGYFDFSKKLLHYPINLEDGTYKIKITIKNSKGIVTSDSLTIKAERRPAVKNAIPTELIYDPASSFSNYKNIVSVNAPGAFNGWSQTGTPLVYDTSAKYWRAVINLMPGDYEYKYYLNGSIWTEDPDNPLTKGSYGNSLLSVKAKDNPEFYDFSMTDGIILSPALETFALDVKIRENSYGSGINPKSIKVLHNGSEINSTFDPVLKIVSVRNYGSLLVRGLHNLTFECTDSLGFKGIEYYSYFVKDPDDSYLNIDSYSDEFLPYPSYIPKGAADIRSFKVSANASVDTLIFNIGMDRISEYTLLSLTSFSQILPKFISSINDLNMNTPEWTDQGFMINIADTKSKYYDPDKHNVIYLGASPVVKGKKINVSVKDSNTFVFSLSTADLNEMLGDYNEKRYFTLFSYLCDNTGNILRTSIENAPSTQPFVYDIAFADKKRQKILLNNYSVSRTARIDAEMRGILGLLPEQINPLLKSDGPVVKILNHSNPEMTVSYKIIEGTVNDLSVSKVNIYRNDQFFTSVNVTNGSYSAYVILLEGDNLIKASAVNGSGKTGTSNSIRLKYDVDRSPKPILSFTDKGSTIEISAFGTTDPDNDIIKYEIVSDDKKNPEAIGLNYTGMTYQLSKPQKAGEYYFSLKVTDQKNNVASIRNYFSLSENGSITIPAIASNPQWVKDAIVYEIFVRSFSPEGNLNGVTKKINYLKDLGINTLWLMPIMDNQGEISEIGGGYSIDDFYKIAPELGNFSDFKTLLDSAHNNGMKVILDITQNHVADKHPWVEDVRLFGKYSNYYNFLERRKLGDDRGLGQTFGPDNIYMRYSNWTLANLNLENDETKNYMFKMFNWWLNEVNIDGFRFDVYWGPQNRYGKDAFWKPARESMKKIKPDIFLLGETDGTGSGSEVNYADLEGTCDAAYDWNWYSAVKGIFGNRNINNLHNRVTNFGYFPGPNSYYFRFMENHDEDRCATFFNNNQNKAALSLLMSIPGIPMIYMGQEVGWKGKRNKISFETSDADVLYPFYKRLIKARSKYPALRSREINRITNNDNEVYSFTRKYKDQNFIIVINTANSAKQVAVSINETNDLNLSAPLSSSKIYYLNDFANDTSISVTKDIIQSLSLSLNPYESKVMLLSDEKIKIVTAVNLPKEDLPMEYRLSQNYPNPFNPVTTIEYSIPEASEIKIIVYDILGREVKTLINEYKQPGKYRINFDAAYLFLYCVRR